MNKLQLTKANPGNFIIENSLFERVKKFNNCLIDFSEQHLEIWLDKEHKVFETGLNIKEENPYMITYIGIIEQNTSFRVIRSGEMIQSISQSKGDPDTITFGSMSSDGFAIHFNLVHSDNTDIKDFIEPIDTTFISNVQSKAEALIESSKDILSIDPKMAKDYISRFSKLLENNMLEIVKFDSIENIFVGYKFGLELGLFNVDDVAKKLKNIEFLFKSSKHLMLEENKIIKYYSKDPNGYINYETLVKIIPNFDLMHGFIASIKNSGSFHSFWGDYQFPLPNTTMEVISKSNNSIKLKGFGDYLGESYEDYALTINISGNEVESIIYHQNRSRKLREGVEKYTLDIKYLK